MRPEKSTPPTATEFKAAREHLPPEIEPDGYVRLGDGTLAPVVRERYYTGGRGYESVYSAWLFGADTLHAVPAFEFARLVGEGRAWTRSAPRESAPGEAAPPRRPRRRGFSSPHQALAVRMDGMGIERSAALRMCEEVLGLDSGSLGSRSELDRAQVRQVFAALDAMERSASERGVPA